MRDNYELVRISAENDWRAYHDIRRKVLWENRGRVNYNDKHTDEYLPDHHPLLFMLNDIPIGTTRLDDLKNGFGVVRLVAISDEFQGKGHGRQLAFSVDNYAQGLGIKTLHVNAAPEALGYYKKLGWEFYQWHAEKLTGIAEDCKQMRKILL
jgi:N-acetylglutamate synthase-like GNAT family acetyltransferase